jgi:hypothetical protein
MKVANSLAVRRLKVRPPVLIVKGLPGKKMKDIIYNELCFKRGMKKLHM